MLAEVKALEFAKDMGFNKIVLEGDSMGVINRLCSSSPNLSATGMVVKEEEVWVEEYPPIIHDIIHNDVEHTFT
ncbi:hypothetical protein DITRI_Ditri02bG0163900 [Diplodiscus trichospermus]